MEVRVYRHCWGCVVPYWHSGTFREVRAWDGVDGVTRRVCVRAFSILYFNREHLNKPETLARIGIIYKQYEANLYWWEALLMLRKITVVLVTIFASSNEVGQAAIVLLALILFTLVQQMVRRHGRGRAELVVTYRRCTRRRLGLVSGATISCC